MAENEILDLGGRRWKPTRAALAKPDLSISAMAQCVADNLQAVLQSSLRKGQTLLSVFQAVDRHPAAMRAVVSMFQDQQLARIARDAAWAASAKDSASIARCAADMLIDGLMSKTILIANGNGPLAREARDCRQKNGVSLSVAAPRFFFGLNLGLGQRRSQFVQIFVGCGAGVEAVLA